MCCDISAWNDEPQGVIVLGPSFERQRDFNPPERRALSAHFRITDIHELGGRLLIRSFYQTRPQRRRKPCIGRPRRVLPIISDRDPGSQIRHYNA